MIEFQGNSEVTQELRSKFNKDELARIEGKFQNISDFNWAWQYYDENASQWLQFDCNDCLVLEFDYQAYKLTAKEEYSKAEITDGTVDFKQLCLVNDKHDHQTFKIRRTHDNLRVRNNAFRRHDPLYEKDCNYQKNLVSSTDVEWMSINYRLDKISKLQKSRRRIILILFLKGFQFFPTLREIRDQLI